MEHKLLSEQQLTAAIRAIMAAGIGEVSENIYRQNIMPGTGNVAERNIAISRLVYAFSPARYKAEWYAVALCRGISRYIYPSRTAESYATKILEDAGIPRAHTSALTELASKDSDIEGYSDLALSIRIADICTGTDGKYVSINDVAESRDMGSNEYSAGAIIDTLYELKRRNMLGKYEKILLNEIRKGESNVKRKKARLSRAGKKGSVRLAP